MKTSTIVWVVVALVIIAGGGWYWYTYMQAPASGGNTNTTYPTGTAGTNGSPNQGNLGQPDQGQVQQPATPDKGGDGTSVNQNLILGLQSDATLGKFLTAYNGMTLYVFTRDTPGVSNCSGTCASTWPPYTVKSAADIHVPATIVGKIGTLARADGTLQVTYNSRPLYFYIKDNKPGDTTGQNVGGVWFVVKP